MFSVPSGPASDLRKREDLSVWIYQSLSETVAIGCYEVVMDTHSVSVPILIIWRVRKKKNRIA